MLLYNKSEYHMEVIHEESLEKMLKIMKTFPRVKKNNKISNLFHNFSYKYFYFMTKLHSTWMTHVLKKINICQTKDVLIDSFFRRNMVKL